MFPLQILGDNEIIRIHRASLQILEKIGIHVEDERALSYFKKYGARITGDQVRLPENLIENILDTCKSQIKIFDRDGNLVMEPGCGNVYFGTCGAAASILDWRNSVTRDAVLTDCDEVMRLCDVLEQIEFICPPVQPTDLKDDLCDRYQAKVALLKTKKPLFLQSFGYKGTLDIIEMVSQWGGAEQLRKKPSIFLLVTCTSPLDMRADSVGNIIAGAQAGVPLWIESGPMAGATSPVTLCGTLAQANAEILAHIALTKMVNPDVPVIYGSWARVFDMKYCNVSVGGPEFGLLMSGAAQLSKFYRLPYGGGGILTNSNCIDAQLGWEKMLTALLPAQAQANLISGMGLISQMKLFSAEALVIDNEIAAIVKRVCNGITVSGERLGLKALEDTIEKAETFMVQKHTKKYFREELFLPDFADCSALYSWQKKGSKDTGNRARERIEEVLQKYRQPEIPTGMEQKLDAIIQTNL